MLLYVIRHADAVPFGEDGVTADEQRPLTDKGRDQARRLGATFGRLGVRFDVLVTSPLVRAVQTVEGMGLQPGRVEVNDLLAPGGKFRELSRSLWKLQAETLGVVGHNPDLSTFVGWLIGSKKAQIELAKAGVACVNCGAGPEKGTGTLDWVVTPDWLDA